MSFNDIIGQETAKRLLIGGIKKNRVPNAYLFYGPNGVGKELTAFTFAKALNCENREFDSCDECASCKKIAKGVNPDVQILEQGEKGYILIDTIRELKKSSSYKSIYGKYRTIIIKDSEKITEEAANAFLKLLEEPPDNTLFILIAQKIESLFPTIISRTYKIPFMRLHKDTISHFLLDNFAIDKEKADFISKLSDGSIGNALSLLEKDEIRENALGFISANLLDRITLCKNIEIQKLIQALESIYRDSLFLSLGLFERIRNSDLSLNKVKSPAEGIRICKEVYKGLNRNVKEEFIKYFLARNLP